MRASSFESGISTKGTNIVFANWNMFSLHDILFLLPDIQILTYTYLNFYLKLIS